MKLRAIIILILFCWMTQINYAQGMDIGYNNQSLDLSEYIVNIENDTFIALRKSMEKLNLNIEWNSEERTVIISNFHNRKVTLHIDENYFSINEEKINLDRPILFIDNSVYVTDSTFISILKHFDDYKVEAYDNQIIILNEPEDTGEFFIIDDDGIFTKSPSGSYPIFYYSGLYERTYFGYFNSKNEIIIRYWDEVLEILSEPVILWKNWGKCSSGKLLGDDHANPSIIVLKHQQGDYSINNGKLLVASAEHLGRLQTRRSAYQEDISIWEEPVELINRRATYARLVELCDGRILLFCRLSKAAPNSRATYYYWESKDSGSTWDGPHLFIDADEGQDDAIYLELVSNTNQDELHCMFNLVKYNDPSPGVHRYKDIYYIYYDVNENLWKKRNGEVVELPLSPSKIDIVYKTEQEDWTYLSDIKLDEDCNPFLLSCTDIGGNKGKRIIVQEHSFNEGTWLTSTVAFTGRFAYANMASYDGGNLNTIYTFPEDINNVSQMEVWKRNKNVWMLDKVVTNDYYGNHARPISVIDSNSSLRVLWNYITEYKGSPYTEWRSMILGYKKNRIMPLD
jgi:hypothetical protein